MADTSYKFFTTDKSFILLKNSIHGNALVIDRRDSTKIEIISRTSIDPNIRSRFIYCCLGIFRLNGESYLVVVTDSKIAANIQYSNEVNVIRKITQVDFVSFSSGRSAITQLDQEEKPFTQVMNLLNSGHFYWIAPNSSYDITRTFQDQVLNPKQNLAVWERTDKRFYWNKYLQKDFIAYRLYDWCFPIVQGYVISDSLGHMQSKSVQYTLISRRSRFRAGTRFNTRGIDDDGNVANFVESEQICHIEGYGILSFLQVRGSVPVFWNQSSPQLSDLKMKMSNLGKLGKISKKKITLLRTTQGTTPAFQNHINEQLGRYQNIIIINLLSKEKQGESDLVNAYEEQIRIQRSQQIFYHHFDLNERTKGNRMDPLDDLIKLIDSQQLSQVSTKLGYFFLSQNGSVLSKQNGVIRTNCKDCLDRTNIVQSRISWILFENQLRSISILSNKDYIQSYPRLSQFLKTVWADNGDALSIQYAGSGSLKSTLTREGDYGIMGMLADGKKTMTRFYVNNFKDTGRQDVLDQLLGLHKSVQSEDSHDEHIRKEISERKSEYSQKEFKNLFIGTYNVGGVPPHEFDICEWLSPGQYPSPDIYIIGFQEVVELTAGQILQTDTNLGKKWEDLVEISLRKISPTIKYTKLQANQLVGLMMVIFVRDDNIHLFREVESQIIKVGLQGLAGNKGGIGLRFLFCDSVFTFVTAHFAAGHGNVEDRCSDYTDIDEQAKFGRQSQYKITDSDYSFWFGDFNFRIDLPDEEIKRNISHNNLAYLYDNDQLKKMMDRQRVFQDYHEEHISFPPTYKYDFGTTRYDTSQKQRAPAWTDRILWRNKGNHDIRQLYYNRCEITTSDHRPVRSYFQLQVLKVDKEKERQLRQQLYESKSIKDGANLSQTKSTPIINRPNSNINGNLINLNHSTPNPIIVTNSNSSINNGNNNNNAISNNNTPQRKLSRPLPMIPPSSTITTSNHNSNGNNGTLNSNHNNNLQPTINNNNGVIQELKRRSNSGSRSPSPVVTLNQPSTPTSTSYQPIYDDNFDPRGGSSNGNINRTSPLPTIDFTNNSNSNNNYSKDMELLNNLHISNQQVMPINNSNGGTNPFLQSTDPMTGMILLPSAPTNPVMVNSGGYPNSNLNVLQPPLVPNQHSVSYHSPPLMHQPINNNYNNYNNYQQPIMNSFPNNDQMVQPIHTSNLNPNSPFNNQFQQQQQQYNNNFYNTNPYQQQQGNNNYNNTGGNKGYSMLD